MTKKKDLNKPKYDEFVKFNLEQRDIAEQLIRQVLPQELSNLAEFDKMQLEPSEHIDPELRKLISDVLWSIPIKGKKAYIYLLIEHESGLKGHDLLPFRFHKYVIRIMEKHLAKGNDKLPIVMPILLYHGTKEKYPHSVSIFDCFESKTLAQKYAFNDIRLIDLTVMSDDEIAKQGFRFFFELVLKYARDKELAKRLVALLESHPELANYFDGKDFKKAFVNLLMSLDLDSEYVASETLKKLDNLTGVDIMTLRQQWEQKAEMRKAQETARSMLVEGLASDLVIKCTGLDLDTVLKLKKEVDSKTQH
ncbi:MULTISPECIES: Rpn family recombination-promoting nuclease/putative transposase [Cysteiniphilum]|uniref:Transposase n=1 Tax=Cysteiniphilum litorale TaxID=2056700 RepID=A0A8J3E9X1_9GAMM|nr:MULTISPECIES: Rpn family recombination-promoting nuclease/putative transposase [Cysteiniphilum]GGG04859.1 transposase [Cysteiniphilum litorale]